MTTKDVSCPVCKSRNHNRDWPSGIWLVLSLCLPPISFLLFFATPNRWCLHCGARFRSDATGAFEPPPRA